ncbi:Acyl-CoA synthetase (AMP-forming)/AMP-acid ligase II [Enhydrobacter aerosaccus]|uniref:3-methylmercaptopropionyl-CoA ligase n=1 Tax=Enhydrobacter aerosaccus TaxID=225324 RepID=A0A1T4SYU1_9HYPH|nr:AMP-binding protein [Enhydrobacter aerosaccus]SKA33400.1 Acyl-CoA synthetase (AMP-forming)/AMP-acid ligase II [Enhydrobacter aerosaccus]
MRLIDYFDRGADLFPERHCLHDGTQGWTYREVRETTHRVANGLLKTGLPLGAKAAVYSPNHAMAYAALLGIVRAGLIWAPVNARNALEENLFILDNTDVEFLFYHSSFADYVARIREACPKIKTFLCLDDPEFTAWLSRFEAAAPDLADAPDDVAMLISSGGTTGRPKGVQITNRVIETMNSIFWASMPIEQPPVHLMVAPMTHAAGVCSFPLLPYGGTNIFMGTADPGAILAAIERHKVTHIYMPPTLIYILLAHPDIGKYDYSSLRHLVYASAPMSVDKLVEAIKVFGPVLTQTYGQAEACMICTFFSPKDHVAALEGNNRHRLASCGKPTPLMRVEVMDDEGRLLPRGQRGEIVVRGGLVMKGYYKNPQATAEASTFGWHHTGDIGVIDEDGFVYIVDRKKDMIISGGFNVFPSEVEQVLWSHPAVQDCAVIGVPDEKWGEAVKAVVELKPGTTVEEAELIALAKEKLGGVKAPKSIDFVATLPRSPVGKVLKKDLRATYWAGRDRKI